MPVQLIGEFGTPGADGEWIVAESKLAIKHLKRVCGEPPPEMELEIQWQEHDLGEYPVIVLTWEDAMRAAPQEYIARCEKALTAYESGQEPPWWSLPANSDGGADEADGTDSLDPELPLEPPAGASFFEVQRYLSGLIEYGLTASIQDRTGPQLVEYDEDDDSGTQTDS
jgi:hypothetical protein